MYKKTFAALFAAASVLVPAMTFAQTANTCPTTGSGRTLCSVINVVIGYMNQALFLLMGIGILIFVWYVIQYYIKPNENRAEAGTYVMYSVIGFFIILSFWGIVNIVQNTFGLQNQVNSAPSWGSFNSLFPTGSGGTGNNNGSTNFPYTGNFTTKS